MTAEKSPKNAADAWIAWAGAFKSIGIKALVTGKFWQFCFLCVALAFAYRISSADWVKIIESVLSNQIMAALGWILAAVFVLGGIGVVRLQRPIYQSEINRLAGQRSELQNHLSGSAFSSSALDVSPVPLAAPITLEG